MDDDMFMNGMEGGEDDDDEDDEDEMDEPITAKKGQAAITAPDDDSDDEDEGPKKKSALKASAKTQPVVEQKKEKGKKVSEVEKLNDSLKQAQVNT